MSTDIIEPTGIIDNDDEYFDTYSFGGTERLTLKDGKQWIEFKLLNEGDRAKFERLTNRDLTVNRKTDEARIQVDQARDRHALITVAVVGWNLFTRDPKTREWSPLSFNYAMLQNWLQVAPPQVVEELEQAIRKANPWLGTENLTVEDIDKQIHELEEQRQQIVLRDQGKGE